MIHKEIALVIQKHQVKLELGQDLLATLQGHTSVEVVRDDELTPGLPRSLDGEETRAD